MCGWLRTVLLVTVIASASAATMSANRTQTRAPATKKPAAASNTSPNDGTVRNADVVQMAGLELSDSLIESSLRRAQKVEFDLAPQSLSALKKANVSDRVLEVMFELSGSSVVQPAPAKSADAVAAKAKPPSEMSPAPEGTRVDGLPSELGVYAVGPQGYTEVQPELVTWRSGGFWKRVATAGIVGGHINGTVSGGSSRLAMPRDIELIIVAPEGTAITEYQLLRLFTKSTRREFRAMSTSFLATRSGADMNQVPFEGEKLKSRTFRIKLLQLEPGEYGLLPPLTSGANLTTAGKIYSFTVR